MKKWLKNFILALSYRIDWNRALRTPDGLWPNEAVSARTWGGGE